ncbi:MAG: EF-P 5-aminopentanol modification-associated protein YfmF [Planctomycetota bacterium]
MASPQALFRTETLGPGFLLHHRRTKAFKTVAARLVFRTDLDDWTAARAMVPRLLARGTARLDSIAAFQTELDRLYGASLGGEARKIGERQIIQFRSDWVHDRIADAKLTRSMADLMAELVHTPAPWTDAIFERERKILLDESRAVFDDKGRYARQRLVEEMCRWEAYARPAIGRENEIESLTLDDVTQAHADLIARAPADLFIVGDLTWAAAQRFARRLRLHEGRRPRRLRRPPRVAPGKVRTVRERQEIGQAKLELGFRTSIRLWSRRYPALVLANALYGGTPVGRLFKEVREKASLCYAVSSGLERTKGLLIVQAGIDPGKYKLARRMILQQLKALQEGDIAADSLAQARAMVLSGLRSMHDSPAALIEFALERTLNRITPDLSGLEAGLLAAKPAGIAAAARSIELDTVFLLTNGSA